MLWGDHGRSTKHGPCPLAPCHLDGEKRCASLEMTGDGSAVTQDRGPDRVTQVSVLKNLQSARVTQPHCTSNQLHKTSQQRLERPKSRAAGRKWGRWCIWWLRVGRAVSGRTRCPAQSRRERACGQLLAPPLATCVILGPSQDSPGPPELQL